MVISSSTLIDLSGLNKRDLKDIERSLEIELNKFSIENLDEHTQQAMREAMYRALVTCKKINKEKYTPKKYRKA